MDISLAGECSHVENLNRYVITLDDDPNVSKVIGRITGITSLPFTSVDALLRRAQSYQPVAAFVDINLDDQGCGLDAIPKLRELWKLAPILVITGDENEQLIERALTLGANDFVRKPLSSMELTARLHARIDEMSVRHSIDTVVVDGLECSRSRMSIHNGDRTMHLPRLETQILFTLLEKRDMLVSRDAVKRRLWGRVKVADNTLDKKISQIRQALRAVDARVVIESHYGKGFLLKTVNRNDEPPECQSKD